MRRTYGVPANDTYLIATEPSYFVRKEIHPKRKLGTIIGSGKSILQVLVEHSTSKNCPNSLIYKSAYSGAMPVYATLIMLDKKPMKCFSTAQLNGAHILALPITFYPRWYRLTSFTF